MNDALDQAAGGILLLHAGFQPLFRFSGGLRIRHVQGIVGYLILGKAADRYGSDGASVGAERDPKLFQKLGSDSACGYPAYGLPAGRAPAAPVITEAVFDVKAVIRMAGPVAPGDLTVIPGSLVGIEYDHGQRGPGGTSLKDAGKDLYPVGLCPFRGIAALSRLPPVQKGLYGFFLQGEAGRGQPSTTTADPSPWDSPQVVILKIVPNDEPDICVPPLK